MKDKRKLYLGIGITAVLLAAAGVLIGVSVVPLARETAREMSLTPTPLPPWSGNVMVVTPDPDAPTPEPEFRNGSKGPRVIEIQTRLQELGYYTGVIDGQFGPATKEAVMAFQAANGITADGIVGARTMEVLMEDTDVPAPATQAGQ